MTPAVIFATSSVQKASSTKQNDLYLVPVVTGYWWLMTPPTMPHFLQQEANNKHVTNQKQTYNNHSLTI